MITSIKTWAEVLNRHFSEQYISAANDTEKRCLTSLIIRKIQSKIIVRYHLTLDRMDTIKKTRNDNVGDDMENENLIHC